MFKIGVYFLNQSKKFFKIDNYKVGGYYLSPKLKIKNDKDDYRESFIIKDENVISVICGKISVVFEIFEKIKKEIIK